MGVPKKKKWQCDHLYQLSHGGGGYTDRNMYNVGKYFPVCFILYTCIENVKHKSVPQCTYSYKVIPKEIYLSI